MTNQNSKLTKCQNCKQNFTIDAVDFVFYEKIQVPAPTFCPECRLTRRLAWRNERSFYSRKCDECGKSVISVYSPQSGFIVYCSTCWWSDEWDGLKYGADFNPEKPFFTQLRELLQKVPFMNLFGLYSSLVNSDYTNMVNNLKNCYLITHSAFNEDCAHGSFINNSKDCVDNSMLNKCELCLGNVNCQDCYKVFYSIDCENCNDVHFSRNLVGCGNCFGCANLRNKNYYIFNKPHSKEEYELELKKYNLSSNKEFLKAREMSREFFEKFPQKHIHERHTSEVSGDYIYGSKNTLNSFIVDDMENSRFCALVTPGGTKDCYDFTHYGVNAELIYESLQAGNQVSRIFFSWFVIVGAREIEYSMFNIGGNNNFGCVGLKKREYCILNKQYSKDDYFSLRKKIIDEMNANPYRDANGNEYRYGEFFPIEISPFCYNETTAQECFPLSKEQTLAKGYKWKEREERNYNITLKTEDLPDDIKDVSDDITKEVIECENNLKSNPQGLSLRGVFDEAISPCVYTQVDKNNQNPENTNCATAFKILPQELLFYRKMNVPLPRMCPNCRHSERIKQRNHLKLWTRKCGCGGLSSQYNFPTSDVGKYQNTVSHTHGENPCPNEFETTYSPERKEIIYCKSCFNQEVV